MAAKTAATGAAKTATGHGVLDPSELAGLVSNEDFRTKGFINHHQTHSKCFRESESWLTVKWLVRPGT